MANSVQEFYGNRIRTRVCGLCWSGDHLLLVNHRILYTHDFWAPPGGGVEFGGSAPMNLEREFREETGLAIRVGAFRFLCEFINPPLHAIELFFDLAPVGGRLETGQDPEMGKNEQIISEVRYLTIPEILALPENHRHGLFNVAKSAEKIRDLKGYLNI